MSERNRIQFECPLELDDQLREYTERADLNVSEVIRAAISEYLSTRNGWTYTAAQVGETAYWGVYREDGWVRTDLEQANAEAMAEKLNERRPR